MQQCLKDTVPPFYYFERTSSIRLAYDFLNFFPAACEIVLRCHSLGGPVEHSVSPAGVLLACSNVDDLHVPERDFCAIAVKSHYFSSTNKFTMTTTVVPPCLLQFHFLSNSSWPAHASSLILAYDEYYIAVLRRLV